MDKEIKVNSRWWNERALLHKKSRYYNINKLVKGDIRLRDFEIKEVGNVEEKKLLHLQCHIGTETLSWARLGASVTGLDFSLESIKIAKKIAKDAKIKSNFIHSNVYESLKHCEVNFFDIVYVSVGSLHWLDNISKWSDIVYKLLKPNGLLYIYEFHPISLVLSEIRPEFDRDYFFVGPVLWDEEGSYTDSDIKTKNNKHIIWDRPLCEIVNAVVKSGLKLQLLNERHGQEYKQFSYLVQNKNGLWVSPKGFGVFPSTYTLKAIK
ncbi:MAG: methyltransferase domain-containing protein [bacterium]|nr:methyltransferase domain-containing protein [bacterium]